MALTKTTKNDKIEVLQLAAGYPVIQVRTATIIAEDDPINPFNPVFGTVFGSVFRPITLK
jgi:hypothetical protein